MRELSGLGQRIRDEGYAFVHGGDMRLQLEAGGGLTDWAAFAASWNDLEDDTYLAERDRYRKRRYAVYEASGADVIRQPHQAHVQRAEYNPLFGGVERWFAPVAGPVGEGVSLGTIIRFCRDVFEESSEPSGRWHVEVHQFRIEARAERAGHPTPEGIHRDGVDYVLVLLVARCNIAQGTTTIHRADGSPLGSFTLTNPLDATLLDDRRVAHGVTPVVPFDPALPAYRDVLVVTFRRCP